MGKIDVSSTMYEISVTPDILVEKSNDVDAKISTLVGTFEELRNLVEKTKGYWISEAGDIHRNVYKELSDSLTDSITRLKDHPRNLLQIASVYSGVELKIEDIASELPGDILV